MRLASVTSVTPATANCQLVISVKAVMMTVELFFSCLTIFFFIFFFPNMGDGEERGLWREGRWDIVVNTQTIGAAAASALFKPKADLLLHAPPLFLFFSKSLITRTTLTGQADLRRYSPRHGRHRRRPHRQGHRRPFLGEEQEGGFLNKINEYNTCWRRTIIRMLKKTTKEEEPKKPRSGRADGGRRRRSQT